MPTPPAAWTFCAFCTKVQLPRVTSTIRPVAPVIAPHASWVASLAWTTVLVRSKTCGPKPAVELPKLRLPGLTVSVCVEAPLHRYICIRGDMPSDGVDMLALLRLPPLASSCASAWIGSPPAPPRPKLSCCALPAASSKPESYHQSCSQLFR